MNPATRVKCNPMPYFTPEQVAELVQAHQSVSVMSIDLQSDLVSRQYRTAEAREHGIHGLSRRIATLARCVDAVFDLLPPSESGVPETRAIDDATIYIQAFIFNVFGCCDNIAWLWVLEQHVLDKKGSPIAQQRVGIWPDYHQFRASCSPEFRTYLESHRTWFDNLKNFRDALAHRIPLYIPPYSVTPNQHEAYLRLDEEKGAAFKQRDFELHDQIEERQHLLKHFNPIMVHSLTKSKVVVFHAQLLADFRTIEEIARKMLRELERRGSEPLPS